MCLNSLNQSWQPTVHLRHILDHHIPWLLQNGNADDPLNTDAGKAMKGKDPKYPHTVRQWVRRYAACSQLHAHGAVWYRDERRKRRTKKKKKFSIAALTANGQNTPRSTKKAVSNKEGAFCSKETVVAVDTPQKEDVRPFQDWWTQSKLLPATPSQSGIKLLPSDTEPVPFDHGQLDGGNEAVCDDAEDVEFAQNPRRKKRRRKMKKLQLEPAADFFVGPNAPNDGDLSSMDEDPVCDLQSYRSLSCCPDAVDHCNLTPFRPLSVGTMTMGFSPLIMAPTLTSTSTPMEVERADRILHVAPLHGKE